MKTEFYLKKLKTLLVCLCAFLALDAQQTLILSEGFEANCNPSADAFFVGCFNNWISTSGTPDNLSSFQGVSAVEGEKYAHAFVENKFECVPFASRGEGMAISHAFEQGKMYKLEYYYRQEGLVTESRWLLSNTIQNSNSGGGSSCNYFIPDDTGSEEVFLYEDGDGSWVFVEFTFTPEGNYDYLWLRPFNPNLNNVGNGIGHIYLDDVSLYEIKENTSATYCDKMEPASAGAWESNLTGVSIEQPGSSGGAGDFYLQLVDGSGVSTVYNETQFSGDWTQFKNRCICWDYKLIEDNRNGAAYPASELTIYAGSFANPTLSATYNPGISTSETDDWVNICAPIGLCENGQLPAGWTMTVGSGCGDWATLLSGVSGISFDPEVVPWNGGGEVIGIDNLCIENCDAGCDGLCQSDADLTACVEEDNFGFISLACPGADFTWTFPPSSPAIEVTSEGQSVVVQAGPGVYTVNVEYPDGCSEELSFTIREDCCEEEPVKCGTPAGLFCEDEGNGPILKWSPVSGAVSYIVSINYGDTGCKCVGPPFVDQVQTSQTFIPVPLSPFDCFSWSVQAVCRGGETSSPSVEVCYNKEECPRRIGPGETGKRIQQNNGLSVYPNPATNSFTVKTKARGASRFLVYNTSGTLLYDYQMNTSEVVVDAKAIGLAPGIYFIEWTDGIERSQEKLIIQ
ncbi:MAG: T9SS type A sorting domain-containing protein [Bacteroidota bacterium]